MSTSAPLPPEITAVPRGSDKIWAVLCHLSSFFSLPLLLPLVVYLAMRGESEYAAGNAREALNFHLSLLIYIVCCIPLTLILVGIPLMIAIGLGSLVFAIIAAVKASEGGCYHYPLTIRLVR